MGAMGGNYDMSGSYGGNVTAHRGMGGNFGIGGTIVTMPGGGIGYLEGEMGMMHPVAFPLMVTISLAIS